MSETVRFQANGATAEGHLALPREGRGPGVIVIQEWWGLNDQIKGVADRLAGEGFVALAPDFYDGRGAAIGEPDEAGKLMMSLEQDRAAQVARGAAAYLRGHDAVTSVTVGVIGFCMGGGLALLTASVAPDDIGAVVDCYGVGPQRPKDLSGVRAPVLGIYGGRDQATAEAVASLERGLGGRGVPFEHHVYPDADHAFLNEQRPNVHRPDDARDAWGRIVPFLRRHLEGSRR